MSDLTCRKTWQVGRAKGRWSYKRLSLIVKPFITCLSSKNKSGICRLPETLIKSIKSDAWMFLLTEICGLWCNCDLPELFLIFTSVCYSSITVCPCKQISNVQPEWKIMQHTVSLLLETQSKLYKKWRVSHSSFCFAPFLDSNLQQTCLLTVTEIAPPFCCKMEKQRQRRKTTLIGSPVHPAKTAQ